MVPHRGRRAPPRRSWELNRKVRRHSGGWPPLHGGSRMPPCKGPYRYSRTG
jgi:hypothetical protein